MKTKSYKNARSAAKFAVTCALACAFMCVGAMISIPLVVPATMQTFALWFCLFYLGGKRASAAVILYILIGSMGIPVFSGFSGGISRLLDAGGGFIFGLALAALVYSALAFLLPKSGFFTIVSAVISHLVLYASGVLWYAFVYLGGGAEALISALIVCVLPFVIPDAAKLFLAYILAKRLPKLK